MTGFAEAARMGGTPSRRGQMREEGYRLTQTAATTCFLLTEFDNKQTYQSGDIGGSLTGMARLQDVTAPGQQLVRHMTSPEITICPFYTAMEFGVRMVAQEDAIIPLLSGEAMGMSLSLKTEGRHYSSYGIACPTCLTNSSDLAGALCTLEKESSSSSSSSSSSVANRTANPSLDRRSATMLHVASNEEEDCKLGEKNTLTLQEGTALAKEQDRTTEGETGSMHVPNMHNVRVQPSGGRLGLAAFHLCSHQEFCPVDTQGRGGIQPTLPVSGYGRTQLQAVDRAMRVAAVQLRLKHGVKM
ncbi:hypothetical protein EYF80_001761 [Liparis tanakae]|uniref:Uncharacterized protein n=1 Tax=Liparis tanakae TaxID=230148 RepID=A0A4Z2JCS5_9TELE|nr:hypothetical protein EYF80_001761 [Liparis tanakae]